MSDRITGLDHVLVGVRDLEAARQGWQRLGFTVSPRGRHIGWGTGNYCLMFGQDYIELLGIIDASQFTNKLDRFLERREGLMGLAFASDDAEALAERLRADGIAAEGPKDLARLIELPEGTKKPAFRLVYLPAAATAGLSAFVCHHLSRELVWQAPWTEHANGATAIREVTVVAGDPGEVGEPYGALLGDERVRGGDGQVSVDCGSCRLLFSTQAAAQARFGTLLSVPEGLSGPWLAALTIEVADLVRTADHLVRAQAAFEWDGQTRLLVAPGEANGVLLEFVAGTQ